MTNQEMIDKYKKLIQRQKEEIAKLSCNAHAVKAMHEGIIVGLEIVISDLEDKALNLINEKG